jgi:pectin methylesterase-like acyl-CoA thioesterase
MDLLEAAMSGSKRLYVSPDGTDTTGSVPHGTQHNPFKTIKAAVASLGSAIASNIQRTTIFVGSGNYTEQNPIAVPPGVAIVGDTLRTVRLTASNPTKDYFH